MKITRYNFTPKQRLLGGLKARRHRPDEHVNTSVMYSKHISIDKLCVTFRGHLMTMKGQFEVKGQVLNHIGL